MGASASMGVGADVSADADEGMGPGPGPGPGAGWGIEQLVQGRLEAEELGGPVGDGSSLDAHGMTGSMCTTVSSLCTCCTAVQHMHGMERAC